MTKIFITGSNGFIGKNLLEHLHVHEVYCYERGESLNVIKDFKPQIVFHLAAELHDSNLMFDSNIRLIYDLLEASKDIDYEKLICVGSSSEYGRKKTPIKESDVLVPDTIYEATKGAGSLLCQAYATTYNKPITIVRPFSVYGKYEPKGRFIPTIYDCYRHNLPLILSEGVHDWICVEEFVDRLISVAFSAWRKPIINMGTGIQTSNQEVITLFEEIVGKKLEIIKVAKLRTYDSSCWVADTTLSKELFGDSCSLREGLKKYIDYAEKTYQKNPGY